MTFSMYTFEILGISAKTIIQSKLIDSQQISQYYERQQKHLQKNSNKKPLRTRVCIALRFHSTSSQENHRVDMMIDN